MVKVLRRARLTAGKGSLVARVALAALVGALIVTVAMAPMRHEVQTARTR